MQIDFTPQTERIEAELDAYRQRGLQMFATSSFQTNSLVLLHLMSRIAPDVPFYFLDTGYHFPETILFRSRLQREFGIRVIELRSGFTKLEQRDHLGRLLYASDPDRCCEINKVLPLDPVLAKKDVWISGVRGSQSAQLGSRRPERKSMQIELAQVVAAAHANSVAQIELLYALGPRAKLRSALHRPLWHRPFRTLL